MRTQDEQAAMTTLLDAARSAGFTVSENEYGRPLFDGEFVPFCLIEDRKRNFERTGKLRLYVGQSPSVRMFPERKDGTFNLPAVVEALQRAVVKEREGRKFRKLRDEYLRAQRAARGE